MKVNKKINRYAEHGKFYRSGSQFNIPVYLDQGIGNWVTEKAKAKGVNLHF